MINKEVCVYGTGGTGINITSSLLGVENSIEGTTFVPVFVDTSESNKIDLLPAESLYLFPDVDGSGGFRAENNDLIEASIGDVLLKLPPKAFNIVICSGSGGTGPVIGYHLLCELLQRKEAAMIIIVGEADNVGHARNTLKTIESLESIPEITGLSAIMHYIENGTAGSRHTVNGIIHQLIMDLGQLNSTANREIDTADIRNWLQYTRVLPDISPELCNLTIQQTNHEDPTITKIDYPISVASLVVDGTTHKIGYKSMYGCMGYVAGLTTSTSDTEKHFVINTSSLNRIFKSIEEKITELNTYAKALPAGKKLSGDKPKKGIVL